MSSVAEHVAEIVSQELSLKCIAIPQGIRAERELAYDHICEIDLFGIADRIRTDCLSVAETKLRHLVDGWNTCLVVVNGPYRIPFPSERTLVIHLTLWPMRWLAHVCPVVLNAFYRAPWFLGMPPQDLVSETQISVHDLLNWHFGPRNMLEAISVRRFSAATWYLNQATYPSGRPMVHHLNDPYILAEFLLYAYRTALQVIDGCTSGCEQSAVEIRRASEHLRSLTGRARNGLRLTEAQVELLIPSVQEDLQTVVRICSDLERANER